MAQCNDRNMNLTELLDHTASRWPDKAAFIEENATVSYGALAARVPGVPEDLRALADADSVAVDPHKWLYAPIEAGCALVRRPGDLLRAYYQVELKALTATNPSGHPSAKQKKQAREYARDRVETEAKDGRYLRRKAIPVLWDAPSNELIAALHRLRCATDFFAALFPNQRRLQRRHLRLLDEVLRDLSRLADFAVHVRLRDEFMQSWTAEPAVADPKTAEKAFAMGFALGQQAPEKAARARAVAKAGARLAAIRRFWN